MKTTIILIIAILLLGFAQSARAEKSPFVILAYHGKIMVYGANDKTGTKLTKKIRLKDNDRIVLSGKAYLGLAHKTGNTVEITKAGTYSVKSLSDQILKQKKESGLSGKLAELVISELKQSSDLLEDKNFQLNMQTTGSVERNIVISDNTSKSGNVDSNGYLISNVPRKTNLLNSPITFSWGSVGDNEPYVFNIFNRLNEKIFDVVVNDTMYSPNMSGLKLQRDTYYIWNVNSKKNPEFKTNDRVFSILSDAKEKGINSDVESLKKQYDTDISSLGNIILAHYYETKGLYLNALNHYSEALRLSRNADAVKVICFNFLERMKKVE